MSKENAFCHVFLSFRGETRDKFACFLYEALKDEGFVVLLTIKEGIKNSMSAILIFSQNYAYSTWCLDELVFILERMKSSRYFILPIYYEVKSRDIKHQLGNYSPALEKHRARHGDKVEKWREALVQVGKILGEHVEGRPRAIMCFVYHFQDANRFYPKYHQIVFREKLAAKYPVPENSFIKRSLKQPSKDKVILYTTNVDNVLGAKNGLVKMLLKRGNVVFEERNCSKEPEYLRELEELMGRDKVRFPMVTVNGKDLCGEVHERTQDFESARAGVKFLFC